MGYCNIRFVVLSSYVVFVYYFLLIEFECMKEKSVVKVVFILIVIVLFFNYECLVDDV